RMRSSGNAWIGFAELRKSVTRPGSPRDATIAPSDTATACTRWCASTTPPRVASTTIGSTASEVNRGCGRSGNPVWSKTMDQTSLVDYDAEDVLVVSDRRQLRALAGDVRTTIVALLRERARSTQQLAKELDMPKGTVGHHLKVLEQAGLIRVVATRQVRAVTEKFYGRTARLFLFEIEDAADLRALGASTFGGV